jgi:hypothetical protein
MLANSHLQSFSVSHLPNDSNRAGATGPKFRHHRSYTAPRPVANYVTRPYLHRQIRERLHDGGHDATDTCILVARDLGG